MLLQNVSVLHYPDSLTTCNSPEVTSPDLAADAVQTCWRQKALLSEWLTGMSQHRNRVSQFMQQSMSGMTPCLPLRCRLTKKLPDQTDSWVLCWLDIWAKYHSRWPTFHSNIIRLNWAFNENTAAGEAELRTHLGWTETSWVNTLGFWFSVLELKVYESNGWKWICCKDNKLCVTL